MNTKYVSTQGFTLIELLVVVIIIAILAAIAVPQYKHAALKSRFSTVMPMAKAIADANEVYYQGRQLYALDVDELDVTPVVAENTSVTLSQTDGYDYVMAQNSKVPGANYIIYQKYSENYPSEIHCEAEDENADANWLCGVLSNNNSIGKTITAGYTTYIINGTGAGIVPGADSDPTNENGQVVAGCESAAALGYTCNITTNAAGQQEKQICKNGVCRTKTYNEDGSYTSVTCEADSNGVCTSNWKSATYDANGNQTATRTCSSEANSIDSNGNCVSYSYGHNYTYDANGNKLTDRNCETIDSDGNCTAYKNYESYDYTYDANGNKLTERFCSVNSSGNCTAYNASASYYYTYDANGNQLTRRTCNTMDSSGNCTAYGGSGVDYTYDANGNKLTSRACSSVNSSGTCTAYSSTYNYTYDANGNKLTYRQCDSIDSDGTCTSYKGTSYYYTYDDNGKQIGHQYCSGSNLNTTTGDCIAYDSTTTFGN